MKKPTPPSDLWAKMDALNADQMVNDEGITVAEFGERYNLSDRGARWRIERLVKDGKLIAGSRRGKSGHRMQVFRPAE